MPITGGTESFGVDLTSEFHAADWTLRGRAFTDALPDRVQAIKHGIYAHLSTNDVALAIFDRNGPGKIIVPANGSALKSGKFQHGVAGRMLQNHDHFHRRPSSDEHSWKKGAFCEVLRWLLVLDLSQTPAARDPAVLRHVETGWNRHVRSFLRQGGFAVSSQNARSESRFLVGAPPSADDLRQEFRRFAHGRSDLRPCGSVPRRSAS